MAHYKEKQNVNPTSIIWLNIAYALVWSKRNKKQILDKMGDKSKRQKEVHRHSPRPIPGIGHLPEPLYFSLPTTFNIVIYSNVIKVDNAHTYILFLFHVIIWDEMLSSAANVIMWDEMLSSGMKCYHLELMLSSGTNVIILS